MFVNSNVPCMRVYTCVRMYVYVLLQTLDIFCIRLKIIEYHYICKERNLIIFSGTSTIDKIHDNCITIVLLIYLSIFAHFCISIFTYNTYIFCTIIHVCMLCYYFLSQASYMISEIAAFLLNIVCRF